MESIALAPWRRIAHATPNVLPELVLVIAGLALFFVMPDDLGFASSLLIGALFALSLDLVLGYAGIVTLGHAALFGMGAYAASLFALHLSAHPLLGLLVGGLAGAVTAALSGLLVLRSQGLTSVMITLAIAQLLLEVGSRWRSLTGGDDGLASIPIEPLFGTFEFDFMGRTGFLYALAVLVVSFAVLRRVVSSPFGLTSIGIREDRVRMTSLGARVSLHLWLVYVLGGVFAGVAGALSSQLTQSVGLHSFSFTHSAEVLVMLVLGGTGRLWGAVVGTALFMLVHHLAAGTDPFRWMFVIGTLLLAVVLVSPAGLCGAAERLYRRKELRHG